MRIQFSKCGHKGMGAFCHRCAEADRLEAIGNGEKKPVGTGRKDGKPVAFAGWKKEDFLAEAKRLRGPQSSRKGRQAPVSMADQISDA